MTEVLQFQFRGVEQGADPKALPPGTLLEAKNCAMDKARRLCKRAGTASLTKNIFGGSNVASGSRLLLTGDDTAQTNTETAYVYAPPLAKWKSIDRPPSLMVTRRALVDTVRSAVSVDIAITGDYQITAYITAIAGSSSSDGSLYYRVDSVSTGQMVLGPTLVTATGAFSPRVLVNGAGTLVYIIYNGTTGNISCRLLTLSTLAGSTSIIAGDGSGTGAFDAVIGTSASGETLYLAYTDTTPEMRIRSFVLSTLASVATQTEAATDWCGALCIAFGSLASRVTVAFSDTTDARIVSYDVNLTGSTAGPTTVDSDANTIFVAEDDATNVLVGWERVSSAGHKLYTELRSVAAHAQVAASVRASAHLLFPSKPWRVGTRWFTTCAVALRELAAVDEVPTASTVVVEIETSAATLSSITGGCHPHMATLENQTGWFENPSDGTRYSLTKTATDANGYIHTVSAYRNRELDSRTVSVPVGWAVYTVQSATGDVARSAQLGPSAMCVAAAPYWNDGHTCQPYGFVHAPIIHTVTDTGVGSLAAGVYSYVATYAWRDRHGVLHRSTPSPPKSGTAGASRALTVEVATTSISGKSRAQAAVSSMAGPVMIELWRTTVGGTGSHYRLTLEPEFQMLVNDPFATSVSLIDTKADADIAAGAFTFAVTLASRAQLYTDAGELANVPPPAFVTGTVHRGRLVGLAPDLRTVWLSKDSTQDATLAPGFNEALQVAFASDKTALASLDEKLIVFGESTIDVVHGDGPDDAGQNNTWQVQSLQTDVGCVNPRSVVTTPMGVVFESSRGIELLTRELTVAWVGESIEDTLASFPTITSAVLVPDEQEIRFTCNASGGATGIVLAWNYAYKAWFTRTYADLADTSTVSVPFVDAALIDGVYTLLTAGGQVYRETTAHKLDNGTGFVARDVVLAPISPAGNLSWHRVKQVSLMGTSVTNHDLAISIARDFATSYEQTATFLAGSTATATGPNELCRVYLTQQKCQAVKIRIQDATPTSPGTYPVSTGDGPIFEAVALRVGVKKGTPRTAAGQHK